MLKNVCQTQIQKLLKKKKVKLNAKSKEFNKLAEVTEENNNSDCES